MNKTADFNKGREHGWLVFHDFWSTDEVTQLQEDLVSIASLDPIKSGFYAYRNAVHDSSSAVVRIERFVERSSFLYSGPVWARIQRVADEFFETRTVLFKDKINFRYPQSAAFGPHQDASAGWTKYADRFVTIGIFPDGTDWNVGGLEMTNQGHHHGILPNQHGQIAGDVFHATSREQVSARSVDILVLGGLTPHRSNINQGSIVRRHVFLTFAAPPDASIRDRYYHDKLSAFPTRDGYYDFRLFSYGQNANGQ